MIVAYTGRTSVLIALEKKSKICRPHSMIPVMVIPNILLAEHFLRVGCLRNIQNECVCSDSTEVS